MVVTPAEAGGIEIADFGLGQFTETGLGVLVYVNTQRCCAKELVMWPRQTCPEHRHPDIPGVLRARKRRFVAAGARSFSMYRVNRQ